MCEHLSPRSFTSTLLYVTAQRVFDDGLQLPPVLTRDLAYLVEEVHWSLGRELLPLSCHEPSLA
jgi:hypothetical protein